MFLNSIYAADVADQDDVIGWYKAPAARGVGIANQEVVGQWKALWDQGGRFVKALAEADVESEEEDSDEDDSE